MNKASMDLETLSTVVTTMATPALIFDQEGLVIGFVAHSNLGWTICENEVFNATQ